jgi:hypothetical protein
VTTVASTIVHQARRAKLVRQSSVNNDFWAEGGEADTLLTICVNVIISMA